MNKITVPVTQDHIDTARASWNKREQYNRWSECVLSVAGTEALGHITNASPDSLFVINDNSFVQYLCTEPKRMTGFVRAFDTKGFARPTQFTFEVVEDHE